MSYCGCALHSTSSSIVSNYFFRGGNLPIWVFSVNAVDMDDSICHSFDLGGLEDEGRAAYGFVLD